MEYVNKDMSGSGIFIQFGAGAGDLDTNARCRDGFTELLALDIEGIDAEVILDIDPRVIKFRYISFEYIHLDHSEDDVYEHLSKNGLIFLGKGLDHNGLDHLWGTRLLKRI
jgi:hypothetical protein